MKGVGSLLAVATATVSYWPFTLNFTSTPARGRRPGPSARTRTGTGPSTNPCTGPRGRGCPSAASHSRLSTLAVC